MRVHFREVLRTLPRESLYETAILSYEHPNRLLRFVFWQRIELVRKLLPDRPMSGVLDFGSGTGVLLPLLASSATNVVACEMDPRVLHLTLDRFGLRDRIMVVPTLAEIPAQSLDLVVALDVLEHVDKLDEICDDFARVLKGGGRVVISGPTESALYRIGRSWAGFESHSHVRDIYDIEAALARHFLRTRTKRLFWWPTFFRISAFELRQR